jgi:hypothetical protein
MDAGVAHAIAGTPLLTVNEAVAVAAAYFPAAAWLALRTIASTPVMVTVAPETIAGPELML